MFINSKSFLIILLKKSFIINNINIYKNIINIV